MAKFLKKNSCVIALGIKDDDLVAFFLADKELPGDHVQQIGFAAARLRKGEEPVGQHAFADPDPFSGGGIFKRHKRMLCRFGGPSISVLV